MYEMLSCWTREKIVLLVPPNLFVDFSLFLPSKASPLRPDLRSEGKTMSVSETREGEKRGEMKRETYVEEKAVSVLEELELLLAVLERSTLGVTEKNSELLLDSLGHSSGVTTVQDEEDSGQHNERKRKREEEESRTNQM